MSLVVESVELTIIVFALYRHIESIDDMLRAGSWWFMPCQERQDEKRPIQILVRYEWYRKAYHIYQLLKYEEKHLSISHLILRVCIAHYTWYTAHSMQVGSRYSTVGTYLLLVSRIYFFLLLLHFMKSCHLESIQVQSYIYECVYSAYYVLELLSLCRYLCPIHLFIFKTHTVHCVQYKDTKTHQY